jgi:hypothetical protein
MSTCKLTRVYSLTVASDSLATYRFQFAFWIAVTLPFAIGGVNGFIYDKGFGRGLTTGAGWLLCSMVDVR